MKKLVLFLLLSCSGLWAQAFYSFPQPFPNAKFYVCVVPASGNPCSNQAPIFRDVGLSQSITQPVTVGVDGQYGFWVSSGQYAIQLQAPYNLTIPVNLGGGGGGVSGCTIPVSGQLTCSIFTANTQLTTPQINGSGTGGYNLTSPGATLPATPGTGNNGFFSGPDGWYLSYLNDTWAQIERKGHVLPADLDTSTTLITRQQADLSNGANGWAAVFPPYSAIPNCSIFLGFNQGTSTFVCSGLATNTQSTTGGSAGSPAYTVLGTDLLDVLIYTGATDAVWGVNPASGTFAPPFAFYVQNRSTGGGRIILTGLSGATVDGNATLTIPPGDFGFIYSITSTTNWGSLMAPPSGGVVVVQ